MKVVARVSESFGVVCWVEVSVERVYRKEALCSL